MEINSKLVSIKNSFLKLCLRFLPTKLKKYISENTRFLMDTGVKTETLTRRDDVKSRIADMLSLMKFPNTDEIIDGLLDIVSLISDYHEEGTPLFPEIIVTDSVDYFRTFNNYRVKVARKELRRHEFSQSIKMCAPLATEGWNIYIIIDSAGGGYIEFGVLSTELKVMSLGLYEQTMTIGSTGINALYLRNVGNKVVEVRNVSYQLLIALHLSDDVVNMGDVLKSLVNIILSQDDDSLRELKNYLEKALLNALNAGHGNLVAVVSDTTPNDTLLDHLHGGIWLEKPIDLKELSTDYQTQPSEAELYSIKLRSYTNLMQSMLNFDGITLFTNQGRILGYHFIVDNNEVRDENVQGGSRTRAFAALCNIPEIKACFMKSQDGKLKFYSHE